MEVFSPPPPAPRRSIVPPRRTAGSPQATGARRIRVSSARPSTAANSRFATPRASGVRYSYEPESTGMQSGMDIDEGASVVSERGGPQRAEVVFAKSEEMVVSFYANLPVEVKQVLKNADFLYGDPYSGEIDTLTGFALVVSVQTCFVWQHAQAVKGTPTCYIFACPRSESTQPTPPFHALIPYSGTTREPGLILMSPAGEIRFWDSIGMGLAGGEHYSTTYLDLDSDESATILTRLNAQTYLAATTTGRLFRITLTSSGGKQHLTPHVFSRPQSSMYFTSLFPSLFWSSSSKDRPEPGNVSALAIGENTLVGTAIWALVDQRIQKWNMAAEGWEEVVLDEDLSGLLPAVIRTSFNSASEDDSTLDLELVDLAVESSGNLVVLISHAGVEDDDAMAIGTVRRIYSIARLSYATETFKVESLSSVPYHSVSNSGAPMHPRMQLLLGGSVVCIQFGDAVALCARDSDYQTRLELRSSTDRTLGVGVIEGENSLLVLTAASMMKACLDMDMVADFDPDTGKANLVKSIMTQAILYGSLLENPLQFSFPPDVDEESLMQGAEQLSSAVMRSDSEVVRRNHDLDAQLTGRKERLSWLIRFINDNAVLAKMAQRSRQRLATDAEKLYACHQLWLQHNEVLAGGQPNNMLNNVVLDYMHDLGEGHYEDVMRTFFKTKISDIGRVLQKVTKYIGKQTGEVDQALIDGLPEANRIVLTVLTSALRYREHNLGVYGIELPMIRPWTSRPLILDALLVLFNATARLVESPASNSEVSRVKNVASEQLPQMASLLMVCISERLDWLGSPMATDDVGNARDKEELRVRFDQLRPDILETLRRNGHMDPALALAESYRDFRSLVSLCHKNEIYPPDKNPYNQQIQTYAARFKDEFTTELFRWCIEHGELRVLFAQEDVFGEYLDSFFEKNPNPAVSWIHNLGKERFEAGSSILLGESQHASELEVKHLMLSIGKLSYLAHVQSSETGEDDTVLDAYHDGLDFVSVHEALLQSFKSVLTTVRGRQSLDSQVEIIVREKASGLSSKKAFARVFKQLVRQLMQGKALSIEDIADVLTLKDNTDSVEDFGTALQLVAHAKDMPDARRTSAIRTVWRRIYVHDDWDQIRKTSNITDAELSARFQGTALFSALSGILPNAPDQGRLEIDLEPDEAVPVPSLSEITSRWPGMAPEQAEQMLQDYQEESERLVELDLEDVCHRVRELVEGDGYSEGTSMEL